MRCRHLVLGVGVAVLIGALGWAWVAWHTARENALTVAARHELWKSFGLDASGASPFTALPPALPHEVGAARLGGELFQDKRLARHALRTCGACHRLNAGGVDDKVHEGRLTRTVFDAIFADRYLRDGSLTNFGDVVACMITNTAFAGGPSLDEAAARCAADGRLRERFRQVFQAQPCASNIVVAFTQYARTLMTSGRSFDRFCAGQLSVLSPEVREGADLFQQRGCVACHNGPALGGRASYEGKKVPLLRGLSERCIYTTSGARNDLSAVLALMPVSALTDEERGALIAFLKAL